VTTHKNTGINIPLGLSGQIIEESGRDDYLRMPQTARTAQQGGTLPEPLHLSCMHDGGIQIRPPPQRKLIHSDICRPQRMQANATNHALLIAFLILLLSPMYLLIVIAVHFSPCG
jgi:hypothetical protein